MGRSTVGLLTAVGVKVVARDISPDVNELAQTGKVVARVGDSSEETTAVSIVQLALESFGRFDILVNNVGKTFNKLLLEGALRTGDNIIAINARGYFLHAREAVRAMQKTGGGSIVNVASVVSLVGMKTTAAYEASKGHCALTKVLALERDEQVIRANAIGAGVIETDIPAGIADDSRATLASYDHMLALGRVGRPEEIAQAVAWLESPFQLRYRCARNGGWRLHNHVGARGDAPVKDSPFADFPKYSKSPENFRILQSDFASEDSKTAKQMDDCSECCSDHHPRYLPLLCDRSIYALHNRCRKQHASNQSPAKPIGQGSSE